MPAKSRGKKRTEILTRRIEFASVSLRVGAHPHVERGSPAEYQGSGTVELRGKLDEPIRNCSDVEVIVYSTAEATVGKDPVPWIGLADVSRDFIRLTVFLPHHDFDRVWSVALSGRLKNGYLAITAPRYSQAYAVNISLSTDPEE